jgi:hypothetical protein
MDAQQAETSYRAARKQLGTGQITIEEYNRILSELRYQDNNGTWWAINPEDGSWLKWNGEEWVPGFARVDLQAEAAQPDAGTVTRREPVKEQQPAPLPEPQTAGTDELPAETTEQPATLKERIRNNWPGISSLCLAIISWIRYPYLLGIAATILAGYSFYSVWKGRGTAIFPVAGIALALDAMQTTYYL